MEPLYLESVTDDEFHAEFPTGVLVMPGRVMLWGCAAAVALLATLLLMVVFVLAASLVVYLAGVL